MSGATNQSRRPYFSVQSEASWKYENRPATRSYISFSTPPLRTVSTAARRRCLGVPEDAGRAAHQREASKADMEKGNESDCEDHRMRREMKAAGKGRAGPSNSATAKPFNFVLDLVNFGKLVC
ncbi:histone chaperone Rttp106-like protein [Striga asiatica]|uniref:Histone chaperone Rttp106-like protein n=1 Tax=Striga asiatica TaxID=4170 RepID=A0A5A7PLZ6_STRAF|nr:histone chaperone Rttp106-like protein [Striga asiatica]